MQNIPQDQPCPRCGRYANRGVSVDAVIIQNNQVLLIRRGKDPFKDFWGTPGGYVGWDESAEDALRREVKEETGLEDANVKFVTVSSDPKRHPQQVINLVFLVTVKNGQVKHGDDTLDARWFDSNDLPKQLAFDHKENIEKVQKFVKVNHYPCLD